MGNYHEKLINSRLFSGMIYSGCKMWAWCFSMSRRNLFYTTCPDEQEFLLFFSMSGCQDYIFSPKVDTTKPLFLSDSLGMVWVADYIYQYGKPDLVIVIGPVFSSSSSVRGIEDSLKGMNFSIKVRNNMLQILQKVPVVSIVMMYQYAAMLHYALTDEPVASRDFQFQHPVEEETESVSEHSAPAERVSMERERMIEETILQMIREGNLDYKQMINEKSHIIGPDDYQTKAPQRDNKNIMLIFVALCSRAAMEGGLSPRTAKNMEIEYITMIEKAKTVTELINIKEKMMDEFVCRVHQCRTHPEVSKIVQECCDYIQRNLLKPLELSDIAGEMGYAEYYLSKKFYKEMGVRLLDYVSECRIELAKIWLLTTRKSIQEISDQMYFGSRSYFSRVFRKKVGMTPVAFREQLNTVSDIRKDRKE